MEKTFGANIRFLRKQHKLTLETLAIKLKISKSAISDYETGKTFPSLELSENIARNFRISLDKLRTVDFSKLSKTDYNDIIDSFDKIVPDNDIDKTQSNQLGFQNKLLQQQVDGLSIQLKLIRQVVESKEAEIRSLRIQLKLLNERYPIDL
jgi:transcriptional regulator with XRE-family HTH domain